jgi:CRISPR/Cas system-associated endonuclease Cas3-HD
VNNNVVEAREEDLERENLEPSGSDSDSDDIVNRYLNICHAYNEKCDEFDREEVELDKLSTQRTKLNDECYELFQRDVLKEVVDKKVDEFHDMVELIATKEREYKKQLVIFNEVGTKIGEVESIRNSGSANAEAVAAEKIVKVVESVKKNENF